MVQLPVEDLASNNSLRSEENGLEKSQCENARVFMNSCSVAGQKLGHIHRGVELGCVSSMRVQIEGVRLLILARIKEVADVVQKEVTQGTTCNITDIVDWLLRLDDCPPATSSRP